MPAHYALLSNRKYRIYTWFDNMVSNKQDELQISHMLSRGWSDILNQYNRCSLTKRSDRLVAIRGLADLFEHLSGDEYISGLWRSHIWSSLAWRVIPLPPPLLPTTTNYDDAPSFLWAAVDGEIEWRTDIMPTDQFHPFLLVDGNPERLILRGFAPVYDPYDSTSRNNYSLVDYDDSRYKYYDHYHHNAPWAPSYFLLLSVGFCVSEDRKRDKWSTNCMGKGIVVRPISGVGVEGRLQCMRVGYFEKWGMTGHDLAAFGMYDMDMNFKEREGFEKIDFVLR